MADAKAGGMPENHITLEWADGEYAFRLPVGQIAELQEKCGAGVGLIFARMSAGRFMDKDGAVSFNPLLAQFRAEDVFETIRLGLIGGGHGMVDGKAIEVNSVKALQLVRSYVHARPLLENWRVAYAILAAYIVGYADPNAQKKSPRKKAGT